MSLARKIAVAVLVLLSVWLLAVAGAAAVRWLVPASEPAPAPRVVRKPVFVPATITPERAETPTTIVVYAHPAYASEHPLVCYRAYLGPPTERIWTCDYEREIRLRPQPSPKGHFESGSGYPGRYWTEVTESEALAILRAQSRRPL